MNLIMMIMQWIKNQMKKRQKRKHNQMMKRKKIKIKNYNKKKKNLKN